MEFTMNQENKIDAVDEVVDEVPDAPERRIFTRKSQTF
jgi:hypothetical protein